MELYLKKYNNEELKEKLDNLLINYLIGDITYRPEGGVIEKNPIKHNCKLHIDNYIECVKTKQLIKPNRGAEGLLIPEAMEKLDGIINFLRKPCSLKDLRKIYKKK